MLYCQGVCNKRGKRLGEEVLKNNCSGRCRWSELGACDPSLLLNHRLLSSSFLGLPYRILNMNHKKELLRSLGEATSWFSCCATKRSMYWLSRCVSICIVALTCAKPEVSAGICRVSPINLACEPGAKK